MQQRMGGEDENGGGGMSEIDRLIVQYRKAWRKLWRSEPPIVRKVGKRCVEIVSEDGKGKLRLDAFRWRIEDMTFWAAIAPAPVEEMA
jgi:hypothetical protein